MKRVWCLYRVSTKKQVNPDDDIPMQRNACHKFVDEKPDWKITNELYEKGISGWKISADDRDEMNIIKEAAIKKQFDVLLVFKNDRLGRKEDETPFFVSFLVDKGIEVWSTIEKQSKVESHVDKLINYITYWQADGESQSTSIRVKEKIEQMNAEAKYTGSNPPYGYEVYDTGQKHHKYEKNIKDMKINESESKVVEIIFDLYNNKNYGTPRIVQYLNEHGYRTRKGNDWRINTVFSILKNTIYTGIKRYNVKDKKDHSKNLSEGEWKYSPVREDWIIISETEFNKAQRIMESRRENQKTPAPRKGKLLLNGIAYCGYCHDKLYSDIGSSSYKLKDGTVKTRQIKRYRCLKSRQSTIEHERNLFTDRKYEKSFEMKLKREIDTLKNSMTFSDELTSHKQKGLHLKQDELKMINKQLKEKESELTVLNNEVTKSLLGKSAFNPEQLSSVIEITQKEVDEIKSKAVKVEKELDYLKEEINNQDDVLDLISNWEEKYNNADLDEKKVLISKIVGKVYFYKDTIEYDLKFKA